MKVKKAIIIAFLFVLLFSSLTLSVFAYDYYIVNKNTGKYHEPTCSYLPYDENSYEISSTSPRLSSLSPCSHCRPDIVVSDTKPTKASNYYNFKEIFYDCLIWALGIGIVLVLLFGLASFIENRFFNFLSTLFLWIGAPLFCLSVAGRILGEIVFFVIELFI